MDMSVIPAPERIRNPRPALGEFKVSLSYMKPCLKKQQKRQESLLQVKDLQIIPAPETPSDNDQEGFQSRFGRNLNWRQIFGQQF